MKKRLIDANAFMRETFFQEGIYPHEQLKKEIENAPTVDAVEVVRCKDCIYYEIGKDYLPYCNHADGGIADYPRADDFCSYGERKDNENP